MMPAADLDLQAVQGIQFKILAQVFPVLRHDALKPLSNAKLTIVLLEKAIAKGTITTSDPPPFVGDLDTMLDESVAAIRLLNNWFSDESLPLDINKLLHECRKLAFSQLLMSGKKVQIGDFGLSAAVPHRTSRYFVMAWLLLAVQSLPPRGILHVDQDGSRGLRAYALPAPPDSGGREPRAETAPPVTRDEVEILARAYGWSVEKTDDGWVLALPERGES
jgi:hypothetical protein